MTSRLPEDILHLICDELQYREDFASLFNCAVVGKVLAPIAISHLYRMQRSSENEDETESFREQELVVPRWAVFWRSICLATMEKTMFPYHRFLRCLDLRDLEYLLNDDKFRGKIERTFFEGPMAQYQYLMKVKMRRGDVERLNVPLIVEAIAEVITSRTELLEELWGGFSAEAFARWVPRLPRLKRLELYHGHVLADERIQNAICDTCPHFEALSMFRWIGPDADTKLATFIQRLPPQSLKDLTTFSGCGISVGTCAALGRHGQSLKKLELNFQHDTIGGLAFLGNCINITYLQLEIPRTIDLERAHPGIYASLAVFFGACRQLKSVTLTDFRSGPSLLTPLLLNEQVHLEELTLNASPNWNAELGADAQTTLYSVKDNRDFHHALAHQPSLQILCLTGDDEDVAPNDVDVLIESISQLRNLKKLKLQGVSDTFHDDEMIRILSPLQAVEELYLGGWSVTDFVLNTIATLRHLRAITFSAFANFTTPGLLDFVAKLGPGNEGLHFSIDNADPSNLLSDEELAIIRSVFSSQISGKLDYIPFKDPNISDFEDSGDSD